jgi:hypothetical protein
MGGRLLASVIAVGLVSGVFDQPKVMAQEKKPPVPSVTIVNETPGRVFYRVKLWQGDYNFVMAGRDVVVPMPENLRGKMNVVQVEARSRAEWDNCFASIKVGGKLIITLLNDHLKLKCTAVEPGR